MLKFWLNKKLLILLIKRQEILNNSNLTNAQKQKAIAEINKALQKRLKTLITQMISMKLTINLKRAKII